MFSKKPLTLNYSILPAALPSLTFLFIPFITDSMYPWKKAENSRNFLMFKKISKIFFPPASDCIDLETDGSKTKDQEFVGFRIFSDSMSVLEALASTHAFNKISPLILIIKNLCLILELSGKIVQFFCLPGHNT